MIILIYTGVSDFFFHGLYFQCLIEEGQSQKGTYFANQLHKTLSYAKRNSLLLKDTYRSSKTMYF